ncbi:hypothetical protein D9M72_112500 [compost metagenome]
MTDVVAVRVHQARVGVQQHQGVVLLETSHHFFKPIGHPDVVLIAQRNQLTGACADGLLEILDDAQRRGVLEDPQRHGMLWPLGGAFSNDGTHHIDRTIARGIVGQDDLDRRTALKADAANLLAQEARAVVRAQRNGNFKGTGDTHGLLALSSARGPSDVFADAFLLVHGCRWPVFQSGRRISAGKIIAHFTPNRTCAPSVTRPRDRFPALASFAMTGLPAVHP